jgi:hypothetical protein
MTSFRVLPGLPATGPAAETFPKSAARLGREGFVVEIFPENERSWVGNFGPGLSNFSAAFEHPDGRHVLVISNGQGYVVEPSTRRLVGEVGGAIIGVTELSDPPSLLLNHQGIAFERVGPHGRLWRTRRLSWDGFKDVQISAETISGLGWAAPTDTWEPFEVDIRSGRTLKTVYVGPDLTHGEVLRSDGAAA